MINISMRVKKVIQGHLFSKPTFSTYDEVCLRKGNQVSLKNPRIAPMCSQAQTATGAGKELFPFKSL